MKNIKVIIISIILGVLAASSFAAGDENSVGIIIDTRTEAEWNIGHLEGAVLIPYDRIVQGITAIAPDKKARINLYCRTGRRSGIALDTLKRDGYSNLTNLGSMENASAVLRKTIVK